MEHIDISNKPKHLVLAALFNASRQQGLGFLNRSGAQPMSADEADQIIRETGNDLYFDYLRGRVMKVDLAGPSLDPYLYDRDNGAGAAARAVATVRPQGHRQGDE